VDCKGERSSEEDFAMLPNLKNDIFSKFTSARLVQRYWWRTFHGWAWRSIHPMRIEGPHGEPTFADWGPAWGLDRFRRGTGCRCAGPRANPNTIFLFFFLSLFLFSPFFSFFSFLSFFIFFFFSFSFLLFFTFSFFLFSLVVPAPHRNNQINSLRRGRKGSCAMIITIMMMTATRSTTFATGSLRT
jgi:hypothetical protein